jgi:hypothetical protein
MGVRHLIMKKDFLFRGIDGKWQIVMTTPLKDIHKDIKHINYIIFILICISLILILFFYSPYEQRNYKPGNPA